MSGYDANYRVIQAFCQVSMAVNNFQRFVAQAKSCKMVYEISRYFEG